MERERCPWCLKDDIYKDYHDRIWGRPEHDDAKLFEKLCLDGAQAGLSWYTILIRTESYRKALDGWDAEKIACLSTDQRTRFVQRSLVELRGTHPTGQSMDINISGAGHVVDQ